MVGVAGSIPVAPTNPQGGALSPPFDWHGGIESFESSGAKPLKIKVFKLSPPLCRFSMGLTIALACRRRRIWPAARGASVGRRSRRFLLSVRPSRAIGAG